MKPSGSLKFFKYPELVLLWFWFCLSNTLTQWFFWFRKFSNTQNQWFFHSGFFFFAKYSEHMGITKNQIPTPTLVFFLSTTTVSETNHWCAKYVPIGSSNCCSQQHHTWHLMLVISFVQRYILVTSEFLDQRKNALTNYLLIFGVSKLCEAFLFWVIDQSKRPITKTKQRRNQFRHTNSPPYFSPNFLHS